MALQELEKAAPVDDFQLITCTAARLNVGLTAEGEVKIINIAQNSAARHASPSRQFAQRAGLLFEDVHEL